MEDKIKIGISSCLLGEKVRYDGGHKLDHYLRDQLGKFISWIPVCPEVECGMSVPREAMRLVGDPANPRLVTIKSGMDHTERMQRWAEAKVEELAKENLCGFVFKSKSPSSGMRSVKVYDANGIPTKRGVGLFASAFMKQFPLVPVEDEGRLHDATLRENFIERLLVYKRWRASFDDRPSIRKLVHFHSEHKLLIMAHSPKLLREMGALVAAAKSKKMKAVLEKYLQLGMAALKLKATTKKNTNVLHHIMGYFKKQLSADEKQELLEIIENYRQGLLPLIVPVTLLKHYVKKYNEPYLQHQVYLNPHPIELMLRNHV